MLICSKKDSYAFSLLEILIATVIFSIVLATLYQTIRTGLRSYSRGHRSIEVMQNARFAMNTLSKDLRSVYYLHEKDYNKNFHSIEATKPYLFYEDNETPYDSSMGIQIDLSFIGENHSKKDNLKFVKKVYFEEYGKINRWGFERVTYSIDSEKNLVRTIDDIAKPFRDDFGRELYDPESEPDVIAFNVEQFDLYYLYFYDYAWRYVDSWDSGEKNFKNPPKTEDLEELERYEEGDPNWVQYENERDKLPDDGLPSAVELHIALRDPGKEDRFFYFTSLIGLPSSREEWMRDKDEEDRKREEYTPPRYFPE